ncbi:hypothetical protein GCM10012287_50110 [Streptomyces daqingensis]|uniref:Peptidase S1 domain-containing protein n=2 Tax=Streptomyces daqingensis TaxID=1472640 RepID=A0ABQ2MPN7_9ACTN|nr:hypothetical protein GCM10012287_50110 [Streptomyces daqingensis]
MRRRVPRGLLASVMACVLGAGAWLGTAAPTNAIEGGWESDGREPFTSMAQIWVGKNPEETDNRFVCSGSVTSWKNVLTAQHCFEGLTEEQRKWVYVKTGDKRKNKGAVYRITDRVSRGDLAVLTLNAGSGGIETYGEPYAELGPNKRPWLKDKPESFGWGKTCYTCDVAPWLKGVSTKVIDNEYDLRDAMGGLAYKVRAIDGRIRRGDSGGPNGHWGNGGSTRVVTGVASTSEQDGSKPANATMSATYDKKGCRPDSTCVHDWLQKEAGMVVHEEGHTDLRRHVMPLGDSITYGKESSDGNGYRDELHDALEKESGKGNVDFVGNVRNGSMPDRENEGHPGKRIDEIADYAKCSVSQHQPNVITLHAGSNDFNQRHELATAHVRMKDLIEQVLEDSPKAVVVVAKVIPTGKPGMQPRIDAFNAKLPGIVSELRADGKHVVLTDTSDVKVSDGLENDAHPNDEGYAKLGYDFARGIREAADKGWIEKPAPQKPDAGCDADESKAGPGWRALGVVAPGMTYPSGRTDLADFDGDGRDDYVRVSGDGEVRIALNRKDRPGKPRWKEVGSGIDLAGWGGRTVRFADIDGDGADDIVMVPEKSENAASVRVHLNNGVTAGEMGWTQPHAVKLRLTDVPQEAVRFADVNGDGRDDYLRVGEDGSVHAYYNLEGDEPGEYWKWKEHRNWAPGVFYGSRSKLRLADVNADGKADYLMVGKRGAVHAYINNGGRGHGGFTEHRYFVKETGYPGGKSAFRDISGDGKADYVVVYDGGSVRAWLNRGGNT